MRRLTGALKKALMTMQGRYFLFTLLVVFVSVGLLTAVIFDLLNEKSLSDIENMSMQTAKSVDVVFSTYINNLSNCGAMIFNDKNAQALLVSGNNSWSDATQRAASLMRNSLSSEYITRAIYLFNINGIQLITQKDTATTQSRQYGLSLIKNMKPMQNVVFWKMDWIGHKDPVPMMSVFFGKWSFEKSQVDNGVVIDVNLTALKDSILPQDAQDGISIYVLDASGRIILGQDMSKSLQPFSNQLILNQMLGSSSRYGTMEQKTKGSDELFSFVRDAHDAYYIVSTIDKSASMRNLYNMRNLIYTILAVIILSTILSYFISRQLYKPMNKMLASMRTLSAPWQPSKPMGDMQFANTAILHIMERMNSLKVSGDQDQLIRYLTGEMPGEQLPDMLAAEGGGGDAIRLGHVLVAILLDDYKGLVENNNENAVRLLGSSIASIIDKSFTETVRSDVFQVTNDIFVLILREVDGGFRLSDNTWHEGFISMQESLKKMLNISVSIGVSECSYDPGDYRMLYHQTMDLALRRLFMGPGLIMISNADSPAAVKPIPASIGKSVQSVLLNHSILDMRSLVLQLISDLACYYVDDSILYLTKLVVELNRLATNELNVPAMEDSATFLDIHQKIASMAERRELEEYLLAVFNKVHEGIYNTNLTNIKELIVKSIGLIDRHYMETGLSVQFMADKLRISPSSFSRIFNEYTGSPFPDYISNVRLGKAMNILAGNSKLDIAEIAQMVGFNSGSYFAAAFKKKFGMTPTQAKCKQTQKGII